MTSGITYERGEKKQKATRLSGRVARSEIVDSGSRYGFGMSGMMGTPLFGFGMSGMMGTPLFGFGMSGMMGTPLFGFGMSGIIGTPLAYEMAMFAMNTAAMVSARERNRRALRAMKSSTGMSYELIVYSEFWKRVLRRAGRGFEPC
jgi:hypothetical protein